MLTCFVFFNEKLILHRFTPKKGISLCPHIIGGQESTDNPSLLELIRVLNYFYYQQKLHFNQDFIPARLSLTSLRELLQKQFVSKRTPTTDTRFCRLRLQPLKHTHTHVHVHVLLWKQGRKSDMRRRQLTRSRRLQAANV